MGREGIKELLANWMFSDQSLWQQHKKIYLRILNERLIKGLSFCEMAKIHKVDSYKLRVLFDQALKNLEESHGKRLADFFRQMDRELDGVRLVMLN